MNISNFRNSYLIDKAYRLTLVSVTLTALAPLIATLVDGLFSSNLLGNDAFIAVSVVLPLVNAVSVLTMICERGGAVLAAGQLAKGKGVHLPWHLLLLLMCRSGVCHCRTATGRSRNGQDRAGIRHGHHSLSEYAWPFEG